MDSYGSTKKLGFILGPIAFLLLLFSPIEIVSPLGQKVIAVASWMVIWWVTEAVSISVTALIPLSIFPIVGIMTMSTVSSKYAHEVVFLFFGGFVMALALEKVQLHKRIALNIIRCTGSSPDRIVLGFMLSTALLSMWISNTATTVVMLPIALSVIELLRIDKAVLQDGEDNFALGVLLGIAFSANIGGVATLIGTPPNSVMVTILGEEFDVQISFARWLLIGVPFSTVMLAICYGVIVKWIYPSGLGKIQDAPGLIERELKRLGPMSGEEKMVLAIFTFAISGWVLRGTINQLFPELRLKDASISMLSAFAMFAAPYSFRRGKFLLDWSDTARLPWGILILFGGGLALAGGLADAGLIRLTAEWIASVNDTPVFWIVVGLITLMLFMTELMSNVALVTIFIPVVGGIAVGLDVPILHVAIPVTMAASCAFMLPMATPPNAIVFASGHIKVAQMVRVGVILNIISILILIAYSRFVIPLVF